MAVLNFFDILVLKPNFFDDADIDVRLDKNQIKMAILERCGTLLPLYTNSEMFKTFSDSFFAQRKNIISKLIDTTTLEYNPIDNYNRVETTSRNYTENNENTTETETSGTLTRNSKQENKVSAYNTDSYSPKDEITVNNTDNDNNTTKGKGKGKNNINENIQTTTKGNIGVTTTQRMIEQERKIVRFNIYNWIAIEFEQHFFICVS